MTKPLYRNMFFLLISIFIINDAKSQSRPESNHHTIIKTNILNILIIPSLHLEHQVTNKVSLQANFHRASFVFFNRTDLLNASLDARYYFKKKDETRQKGMFVSFGAGINHNYNTTRLVDSTYIQGPRTRIGIPQVKIGYQYQSKNHRWVFDTSLGFVVLPFTIQRDDIRNKEAEYRANIGVGYRI